MSTFLGMSHQECLDTHWKLDPTHDEHAASHVIQQRPIHELVVSIGDLYYDSLQHLLMHMSNQISAPSSEHLRAASGHIAAAWHICASHTDKT